MGLPSDASTPSVEARRGRPAIGIDAGGVFRILKVNTSGELITSGGGGDGSSHDDDAAFTVGTDDLTIAGGIYRSTLDLVDDGDGGAFHMTQRRALHTNLRNVAGTEIGTASDPVRTDPTGTTTQPVSGTVTVSQPVSVDDNGGTLSIDDGGGAITVDGTVAVTQPVSVDDNGGSLTVDNAALSVVGGGVEASALRVTIASDSTGLVSVDDGGGTLTVDNTVLSVVGGGTEAAAQRVTIANDSTGVLSVDDNGGSLTVDGTVTSTPGTLTTIAGGTKTVAAAATPEALASTTTIVGVIIQALETNTDRVRVGPTGSEVHALYPLDSITIMIDDPAKVFVDVDVNGEGVTFLTLV